MMLLSFERTGDDYVRHRVPFTPLLFERLAEIGIGQAGQSVLDIGAGTGLFSRELSSRGCDVTLLDSSISLLRRAANSRSVAAHAEALPIENACFDVVTAAQCWHWF